MSWHYIKTSKQRVFIENKINTFKLKSTDTLSKTFPKILNPKIIIQFNKTPDVRFKLLTNECDTLQLSNICGTYP